MPQKKPIKFKLISLLLIAALLIPVATINTPAGEITSYENAITFYEDADATKSAVHEGQFYWATKAKLASNTRATARAQWPTFSTLGFDIELSTRDASVTISVAKAGNYLKEVDSQVRREGFYDYSYVLYSISTKDLYTVASLKDKAAANTIFKSDIIAIWGNAVMRKNIPGEEKRPTITEDGKGGLIEDGKIYHLGNDADFKDMDSTFANETFQSYTNITGDFYNTTLTIVYDIGPGASLNTGSTTYRGGGTYTAKDGKTYTNVLTKGENATFTTVKLFGETRLLNPHASDLNIKRTGYTLADSKKVWKNEGGNAFAAGETYMPKDLNENAGAASQTTVLSLVWKPNVCTIKYDTGGAEVIPDSKINYDQWGKIKGISFKKAGYKFIGWIDLESGETYSAGQEVRNITTETKTITLTAQWQPEILMVSLDKRGGTGGTDNFYAKPEIGFYSDKNCTTGISSIDIPNLLGYNFTGYYNNRLGTGSPIIDAAGLFKVTNTHFKDNTTLYAGWEAQKFPVTFDKQGGTQGSDSVTATYDSVYPAADAPDHEGYLFKGYYTEPNGGGTLIYDEYMNSEAVFKQTSGITLYAHWVDETAPTVALNVSTGTWTNKVIRLTATATDAGSGVTSLILYRILPDGSLETVASDPNANTAAYEKTVPFDNTTEGVVRYKAVATDAAGNTAETYNVVYRDTKIPEGEVKEVVINGNKFYFVIEATDTNVQ